MSKKIIVGILALSGAALAQPAKPSAPKAPLTCAKAADHIVDVALQPFAAEAAEPGVAPRRALEIHQLEAQCRDDAWSPSALGCVMAGKDMTAIRSCVPKAKPVDIAALAGKDISCSAVGNHVADLAIAEGYGLEQDNVAVSVLTDPVELHSETVDTCKDLKWTEKQRRCYARATRFSQILVCNHD